MHAAVSGADVVAPKLCTPMFTPSPIRQAFVVLYRLIVERLATPSVRRILVLDPDSNVVQAIISLSDLAAYLFL